MAGEVDGVSRMDVWARCHPGLIVLRRDGRDFLLHEGFLRWPGTTELDKNDHARAVIQAVTDADSLAALAAAGAGVEITGLLSPGREEAVREAVLRWWQDHQARSPVARVSGETAGS